MIAETTLSVTNALDILVSWERALVTPESGYTLAEALNAPREVVPVKCFKDSRHQPHGLTVFDVDEGETIEAVDATELAIAIARHHGLDNTVLLAESLNDRVWQLRAAVAGLRSYLEG